MALHLDAAWAPLRGIDHLWRALERLDATACCSRTSRSRVKPSPARLLPRATGPVLGRLAERLRASRWATWRSGIVGSGGGRATCPWAVACLDSLPAGFDPQIARAASHVCLCVPGSRPGIPRGSYGPWRSNPAAAPDPWALVDRHL